MARGLGGALKKYGPDSIGFLSSSKCTNEENYLIEKLARLLGSPNIDNCARLCHAPSVVGLNRTLGAAGMTNPIPDLANSKCIFIIGSNLAENHPILSRWIHRAKDAGAVVIVADPRMTHTAWMADIFLQLKPGTDVALLNGMAHVIIKEGLIDRDYIAKWTRGYEELAEVGQRLYSGKGGRDHRHSGRRYRAGGARLCHISGVSLFSIPWESPSTARARTMCRPSPIWP